MILRENDKKKEEIKKRKEKKRKEKKRKEERRKEERREKREEERVFGKKIFFKCNKNYSLSETTTRATQRGRGEKRELFIFTLFWKPGIF